MVAMNINNPCKENFNFLRRPQSKAIGFHFLRFSLAESVNSRLGSIKRFLSAKINDWAEVRTSLQNMVRFNKNTILRKKNVEAKGRSIFNYYTQKKS